MTMQLHLDLLGGLAGDMFVACVLDAFPEHRLRMQETVELLAHAIGRSPAGCRLVPFNDGVFSGSRFEVDDPAPATLAAAAAHRHHGPGGHAHAHPEHLVHADANPARSHDHDHDSGHDPHRDHAHIAWARIRATLNQTLDAGTLRHAIGIFGVLAEAEAQVHGVAVDAVEFHEVGAWDSIADIAAAACLIDALDARRWSVSAVPLGSGRVRTAHGVMPVPPPATALLLRGFETLDDGIAGERVTPTGAAILKYLLPDGCPGSQSPLQRSSKTGAKPRVLRRTGVGFGTRRLPGISNCVRLLVFDDEGVAQDPSRDDARTPQHRELSVIEFEVDDQSAEDLAIGLERLREHEAVFDVVQAPVFGKKGRMMTSVRLLARPSALQDVIAACFDETTTIGLRHTTVKGATLPRRSDEVNIEGHRFRVKTVERPGGLTAKAESDDALTHQTHRVRQRLRSEAERLVLDAAAATEHTHD